MDFDVTWNVRYAVAGHPDALFWQLVIASWETLRLGEVRQYRHCFRVPK